MKKFDPKKYWEKRLSENFNLSGVGFCGMGNTYNKWFYKIRKYVFNKYTKDLPKNINSVLDIGSGTGFYINLWSKKRIKKIVGIDITDTAVSKLKIKYPDSIFSCMDISDDIAELGEVKFDVISAFDMLFHIVDDEKYNKAINNISKLLTKDGFFIFSDVFLHSESKRLEHYIARSKKEVERIIQHHGFEIIKRRPVFFFMHTPVDSNNKFIHWMWKMQNKIIHRGDKWANILGIILYPIEIIMINLFKEGPSTEIMICRKK